MLQISGLRQGPGFVASQRSMSFQSISFPDFLFYKINEAFNEGLYWAAILQVMMYR